MYSRFLFVLMIHSFIFFSYSQLNLFFVEKPRLDFSLNF
ncbi:hypothetical protein BAGQ_1884 [Bacillus velezensis]|nr:hypothetical protein BAGQ_1884 [Bacillus velezensis]